MVVVVRITRPDVIVQKRLEFPETHMVLSPRDSSECFLNATPIHLISHDTTSSIINEMRWTGIAFKKRSGESRGERIMCVSENSNRFWTITIGPLYPNYNHHGSPHHAFTVGDRTFNIAEPKGGKDFVKAPYVKAFLNAMEALGLFAEEEP